MLFKKRLSVPFSLGLVVLVLCGVFVSSGFALQSEMLLNGDFEQSSLYWTHEMGYIEVSVGGENHTVGGTRCLQDSMDDSFSGQALYQTLVTPLDTDYAGFFSFWVKSDANVSLTSYVYYASAGPVEMVTVDSEIYADWTLYNFTLVGEYPVDSITHVWFYISCLGGSNHIWVDDVSLTAYYVDTAPDTTSDFIGNLVQYVAAIVLILAPAGIMFLLLKITNPFLIMFGLLAGVIIGAFVMPTIVPQWAVFGMVIALAGMFVFGRKG